MPDRALDRRLAPLARRAAACLALSVFAAAPAAAQTVEGVVLDRTTGDPIAAADVLLVDSAGRTIASTVSDAEGLFRLGSERGGVFTVRASALGFGSAVGAAFSLTAGEEIRVRLWLSTTPVQLPALEVTARSLPLLGEEVLRGFRERQARGHGYFFERADIEANPTISLPHMLAQVPGVRLLQGGQPGWYSIEMNRTAPSVQALVDAQATRGAAQPRRCDPADGRSSDACGNLLGNPAPVCPVVVYIDQVKTVDPQSVLNSIPLSDIAAIEVYRGSTEVPPEFADKDSGCGVVAVWTRRDTNNGTSLFKKIAAGLLVVGGALFVFSF